MIFMKSQMVVESNRFSILAYDNDDNSSSKYGVVPQKSCKNVSGYFTTH